MSRALMLCLAVACSSAPPEDCAERGTTAKGFSDAALSQYGGSCRVTADCVLVRAMLPCYTGCPRPVLASRQSAAQTAVANLAVSVCGDSACSVSEGCNPVHAECVAGACVAAPGAATGGDAGRPDGG